MDHYFFMPYLYKVPTVSVEDRNGLAKTLYEETYHAPAPSDSERYEKDGSLTTAGMQFRTMLNDYLLAQGQQLIQYEDYSLTLNRYNQQHPASADPAGDMRVYYKNILKANNCAGMLIEFDGDYILCYNDNMLNRLAPYSRTITFDCVADAYGQSVVEKHLQEDNLPKSNG